MSHERSQHDRPSAAYLAGSHIRQLKLVLVNTPSEAAVKLFYPTTEGALRERDSMEGNAQHTGCGRYLDIAPRPQTSVSQSRQKWPAKEWADFEYTRKKSGNPRTYRDHMGVDNEGKSGCPGQACPSGPPGKCKFPFPAFNNSF